MSRFIGKFRSWFFSGLLIFAPIGLTFYVLRFFLGFVDSIFWSMMPVRYLPSLAVLRDIQGIGFILSIALITLIGFLGRIYIFDWFFNLVNTIFHKTPLLRVIFQSVQSILSTVFSSNSKSFQEVMLVFFPNTGTYVYAFKTNTLTAGPTYDALIRLYPNEEIYSLFVPTTPNPTSGFLFLTPASQTIKIDMSVNEAMRTIVSGGVLVTHSKDASKLDSKGKEKKLEKSQS